MAAAKLFVDGLPNGLFPGVGSVTGAGFAAGLVAAVATGGVPPAGLAGFIAVAACGGAPSLPGANAVGVGVGMGFGIGLGAATRSVFLVKTTICVLGEPLVGLKTKRVG